MIVEGRLTDLCQLCEAMSIIFRDTNPNGCVIDSCYCRAELCVAYDNDI